MSVIISKLNKYAPDIRVNKYTLSTIFTCKSADEFLETDTGKKNAKRSIFKSGLREFEYVKD